MSSSAAGDSRQLNPAICNIFTEGNKRMECCPTMMEAAKASHPECVSLHLNHGSSRSELFQHPHARLPRPLHEAAGATPTTGQGPPSCTLCVEAMIAAGVDTSWVDRSGRSPLQRAAMVGCVSCIMALLCSPAMATNVDATCDGKSTALLEAVRVNSESAVRALLAAGASVLRLTNGDRTAAPLIVAVKAGAYDCIAPLVKAGAVLNPAPASPSASPLLVAASKGKKRTADILRLLVKLGADVQARSTATTGWSSIGQSAIHASARRGRCSCIRVLLELGADPLASDIEGTSPLHSAASNSNTDACQLLVKHITEVSGRPTVTAALLATDKEGRTPLHRAVNCSGTAAECVSVILELLQVSGGSSAVTAALTYTTGDRGRTVVHLAAQDEEHTGCFRALVGVPEGLQVALDVIDIDGQTPVALAQKAGHDLDEIPGLARVPRVLCCEGMLDAARKCHVACVKSILKRGGSFAKEGKGGMSPFALVTHGRDGAASRCSKIICLLLEAGFDPNGPRGDGSPLRHSTGIGTWHLEVCETCTGLLIEAGAESLFVNDDCNSCVMESILSHACYDGGVDLLKAALAAVDLKDDKDGVTNLCNWIGKGYNLLEVPRLLVGAGADIRAVTEAGETVLHVAAKLLDCGDFYGSEDDYTLRDSEEHVELVEWLVSEGAPVAVKDNAGETPMHFAAWQGFENVVDKLMDLGASPLDRNTNGDTSLHMAARASCTTLMARFIDLGIGVNTRSSRGATPLHLAAQSGDASCVRMLLDEGGEIDAKTHGFGWTPLRMASTASSAAALECLLAHEKADGLRQTLDGVGNLLHTAAYHGSTAAMQLLVQRGLGIDSTVVSTGETVLHNAALAGQAEAAKWLLDHGANPKAQDHEGKTPLVSAVIRDKKKCPGYHRDFGAKKVLETIAGSGGGGESSLSVVWEGMGLLHLASLFGRYHCAKFLISKGAGVDSKTTDTDEETPMHSAVRNNHATLVRILAEAGAGMDIADATGKTPLHLASANEAGLEVATLLLDLGASCDITDSDGRTPLVTAAKLGHLACCSLLVGRGADMTHSDIRGENALGASLVGPQSSRKSREAVMKLLTGLGCPIGEAEVDAASRGGLAGSFAEAITARMNDGTSTRQLVKASNMACSAANAAMVGAPSGTTAALMAVRILSEPKPRFSKRPRRPSPGDEELAAKMPLGEPTSGKLYYVDGSRLRRAVSHLEGPDEVNKCLLLKLLLPLRTCWAESYRGAIGQTGEEGSPTALRPVAASQSGRLGSAGPSCPPCSQPATPLVSNVELSCNGEDFDEAGFEAVMEYLSTGQVAGATCGSIHGDVPAYGNGTTSPEVGLRAVASHRAAAYFGLPRLQRLVQAWLTANGAEMEDDGTGVLAETWVGRENSGDGGTKRKFSDTTGASEAEREEDGGVEEDGEEEEGAEGEGGAEEEHDSDEESEGAYY